MQDDKTNTKIKDDDILMLKSASDSGDVRRLRRKHKTIRAEGSGTETEAMRGFKCHTRGTGSVCLGVCPSLKWLSRLAETQLK